MWPIITLSGNYDAQHIDIIIDVNGFYGSCR
jgi:hypothetical protein